MESLFNKEVRVNEEQFDELMELLEKYTDFKWSYSGSPKRFKPQQLNELGHVYIQFWDDYFISHYGLIDGSCEFDLITLEDLKKMLPETSPSELEILQEMVDKLCAYVVDEHWPNFLTVEEAKGYIREETLKTLKGKRK